MKKAVTLLELLITIIILGILASFAIPNYYKAREHALGRAAIANLKLIDAAEEIYRLEFGTYYPALNTSENRVDEINRYLKLSVSADNWDYSISVGTTNAFTATADRMTGGYQNCLYTIQQDSSNGTPVAANCP